MDCIVGLLLASQLFLNQFCVINTMLALHKYFEKFSCHMVDVMYASSLCNLKDIKAFAFC